MKLGLVALCVGFLFPTWAQEPVTIPVEREPHHHVVLDNSYVRVLFVEIPAHETTLLHHHDLPYVSVPPGSADAVSAPTGAATQQGTALPRIGYRAGGFSHAVNNPSGTTLRNIAVELVRPQGKIQNRCEPAVRDQSFGICDPMDLHIVHFNNLPAFETDEILVEDWQIQRDFTSRPWKVRRNMLVAGLSGVTISAGTGIDSEKAPHGILWIPAGSKMVFKTTADSRGHFYSITFKDSEAGKH